MKDVKIKEFEWYLRDHFLDSLITTKIVVADENSKKIHLEKK
jgi:hypothetical protein